MKWYHTTEIVLSGIIVLLLIVIILILLYLANWIFYYIDIGEDYVNQFKETRSKVDDILDNVRRIHQKLDKLNDEGGRRNL